MKTKLIFLILLMACFSCETGKTVSDAAKEKIKGEIKEVVNTFFKGCEDANSDIAAKPFLDSPDFVYILNGRALSYKEIVEGMKPNFSTFLNQKITIIDEKYSFPDESIVLYTTNCTSLTNYKDGHVKLQDPTVILLIFKKISNTWKIIYGVESFIEKSVPNESSKGLNQPELLKKFIGNWEGPAGDKTIQLVQFKNLQGDKILSLYTKGITEGKVVFEGTGFWGYDKAKKMIDLSVILSNGYVFHYTGGFTSPDKLELNDVNNAANKFKFEFISPDEVEETTVSNDKTSFRILKRIK